MSWKIPERIHLFEVANLGYLVGSWLFAMLPSWGCQEFFGDGVLWEVSPTLAVFLPAGKKQGALCFFQVLGDGWRWGMSTLTPVFLDAKAEVVTSIWPSIWKRNLTIVGHLFDFILHLLTLVSAFSDSRFGSRRFCESKNWATSYIEFVHEVLTSNTKGEVMTIPNTK